MSTPSRMANRRSSRSLSDSAGTLTATPGRLMPLLLDTSPGTTRLGQHVGVGDLDGPQHDLAVVDEQRVARADVTRQAGIRRADDGLVALDVARRDGEALPDAQRDGSLGEAAGADLGALQVDEDADGAAGGVAGGPHVLADLLVHGVVAVREVEAGDVHAGEHEGVQLLGGGGLGADGADDLGAAHTSTLGVL